MLAAPKVSLMYKRRQLNKDAGYANQNMNVNCTYIIPCSTLFNMWTFKTQARYARLELYGCTIDIQSDRAHCSKVQILICFSQLLFTYELLVTCTKYLCQYL